MTKAVKIDYLATLRAVIGYLGEKGQSAWWPCSFFGPGSSAFLTPVFGRTAALAQYTAVAAAACRVHDEFLGAGNTHHLFRLPEEMDQDLHRLLADPQRRTALAGLVASPEAALAWLAANSEPALPGTGPLLIGDLAALRTAAAWRKAAGCYAAALAQDSRCYPYFAGRPS